MSTKWKSLIGELCDKSRPQSGKFQLKNLTIFHVYEVEKFDWNALRYIMSTKRSLRYIMSAKWKSLTGDLEEISSPLRGKLLLENSSMLYVQEVVMFN